MKELDLKPYLKEPVGLTFLCMQLRSLTCSVRACKSGVDVFLSRCCAAGGRTQDIVECFGSGAEETISKKNNLLL